MKLLLSSLSVSVVCLRSGSAFSPSVVSHRAVVGHHHRGTSSSLKAINFEENAPRDVPPFEEWAAQCGVQRAGGFQLTSEDNLDWSAFTSEDLATGSPVVYVPGNMVLSSTRIRQELGSELDAASDYLSRLGSNAESLPQFALLVKVLMEYEQQENSPYYPWLNSLPRLYFNAVSMTHFCHECLPPLVFSLSREKMVKLGNFCDALEKVTVLTDFTKSNKDLIKWAFNIVTTRAFGEDEEKTIVPLGDYFNHGTETEVDMSFDEEGNCNVFTTRDVPAGSPLRMSYGCPTNPSKLFAVYGFLDESSPATFCKIMTIKPTDELKNLGLDFSRMLFYKETGDISEEVWDVLLYETLKDNREHQQSFYEAHMRGDANTKQEFHQHYFPQTSAALAKHVDTFLKQLETLMEKTVGVDPVTHPRLPLIMQHNEYVKETFLAVKANLESMGVQTSQEQVYS